MLRSQVGHGVRQASIDKKQVMAFNDDPCGPFRPMAMESIGEPYVYSVHLWVRQQLIV